MMAASIPRGDQLIYLPELFEHRFDEERLPLYHHNFVKHFTWLNNEIMLERNVRFLRGSQTCESCRRSRQGRA